VVRPTGIDTRPAPSATETVAPPAEIVHAQPLSAIPKPLATARPKVSRATVGSAGAVTVTDVVTASPRAART
jgi:hypothetical protein